MKILNICDSDFAGVGIRLTEAINQNTSYEARHICMVRHPFKYPTDIVTRDPAVVRKWVKWADIVNTHDKFNPLRQGGTKELRPGNLIITYHGRHYRRKPEAVNASAKKHGVKKQLCTTLDLTKFGATWLPTAIPLDRYRKMRRKHGDLPIVCQVPSDPKRKNTEDIKRMLKNRNDLLLLTRPGGRPHDEALRHISKAYIYVDRFRLGLGVAGLEAAAMGIPVIAWANAEDEACILREVGYLPYYKAMLEELPDAVSELLGRPNLHKEYADRGLEYIRGFHDYPVVAERYAVICEKICHPPNVVS